MGRRREITDKRILAAARRCFLKRGVRVSVAEIAGELGVSHTTLFNRFGTKRALMIAALGPPARVPWVSGLESGPDDRPIREQLEEQAAVMSVYFDAMQAGLAVLQAAGISPAEAGGKRGAESPPIQAFRALCAWLRRAQQTGQLGDFDAEMVASTFLGTLHHRAMTARCLGKTVTPESIERDAGRLVELLWKGIEGNAPR